MSVRIVKYATLILVGVLALGSLIFGTDLFSYVDTATGTVRETARESVPLEFELQRARDLIRDILPEIQANVRLIARDEVEIAGIEKDIAASREQFEKDRNTLAALREKLGTQEVSFQLGSRTIDRQRLTELVAMKFERLKEAELILASKEKLLETRQHSLQAAMQMLDRAKHRKAELENKVEALTAQHRLLKASSVGSPTQLNDSKLARADQLLSDIQKRIDVSERVLAHEQVDELLLETGVVDEASLLAEIDEHLGKPKSPMIIADNESDKDGKTDE